MNRYVYASRLLRVAECAALYGDRSLLITVLSILHTRKDDLSESDQEVLALLNRQR